MVRVDFVVGNTYTRIPVLEAKLDRSRKYKKIHNWTLYLDVLRGKSNVVERVTFDLGPSFHPQTFVCHAPIPVRRPDGQLVWRFSTRQETYGSVVATLKIRGIGGSQMEVEHEIVLDEEGASRKESQVRTLIDSGDGQLRMLKIPETQKFGIELELTSAVGVLPEAIADKMPRNAGKVKVVDSYTEGRDPYKGGWKIVPDSSIVCSSTLPNCNTFELVSRVLEGGKGLSEVTDVTRALSKFNPKLKVNKSMGFHVHVDVSGKSLQQLIKVCQNFIKYEDVMDSFMPPSRRTGSPESDRYFQSNKASVDQHVGGISSNKKRHTALADCQDIASLAKLMNRSGRYYKLNLQNLVSGRQPTIEFRQHSATINYDKISAWVRFCVALVTNSARLASPKPFKQQDRDVKFCFDFLFSFVIKDRALHTFYKARCKELQSNPGSDNSPCCEECAHDGSSCMTHRRNNARLTDRKSVV